MPLGDTHRNDRYGARSVSMCGFHDGCIGSRAREARVRFTRPASSAARVRGESRSAARLAAWSLTPATQGACSSPNAHDQRLLSPSEKTCGSARVVIDIEGRHLRHANVSNASASLAPCASRRSSMTCTTASASYANSASNRWGASGLKRMN